MQTADTRYFVFLILLSLACAQGERALPAVAGPETVVLLHGLGRSDWSMRPLEDRLSDAGFRVVNLDYPSTEFGPKELVALLHEEISHCCGAARRLHFVTHSMGGILARAYLAGHDPRNLGRVVMLAPPNQGSEYVDLVGDSKLFRMAFGPMAAELGTGSRSLPNRLPLPSFEFGIIAGTRSLNPLGNLILPGESDGTVSVASTQLDGMADFITVPSSQGFVRRRPRWRGRPRPAGAYHNVRTRKLSQNAA